MDSIREIFKIGYGPSSSHTMGPRKAAEVFLGRHPGAEKYVVTLYGSLAATGKGHLTPAAIMQVLDPAKTELRWEPTVFLPPHPNGMRFTAIAASGEVLGDWTVFSIGGGDITDFTEAQAKKQVYKPNNFDDILLWTEKFGVPVWKFVEEHEGPSVWEYLAEVWKTMTEAIERGIQAEGSLPGSLRLGRKAFSYYSKARGLRGHLQRKGFVYAYALAVAEENAAGGRIVTAPTCGSCGIVPAVLYLLHKFNGFPESKILNALATAGLIGNLTKENASISGAEVGCQGEVGTACAMAAGAAAQLFGGTPLQVEYAAEMGMEHHLGLTCDPVAGLVQIPCIERNAFAAARALDCCTYAILSDGHHRVSFDKIIRTMKMTGHDLPNIYKETSEGGLAVMGI